MAASPLSITNINNAWIAGLSDSGLSLQLITDWQHNKKIFNRFTILYHQLATLPRAQRRTLQRQWRHTLAGIAILMVLGSPAMSATIRVNNNCTLVDAITAANTDTATGSCRRGNGADNIVLPQNSTQLLKVINNSPFTGNNGLPVITSDITIVGNSSTILRDNNAPDFRIVTVRNGSLTLQDTTVSGGRLNLDGGAILSIDSNITLNNSTISGNTATAGGGIYSYLSVYNYSGFGGKVQLFDSNISDNTANSEGGGIRGFRSLVSLTDSTVSGNTAGFQGGGIYSEYGTIAINRSTISNNTAGFRGGALITAYGGINLSHSTISNNSAGNSGGGVYNLSGGVNINNSTVTGNVSGKSGGGLYNYSFSFMAVIQSTVTGNEAGISGGGFYGGGIFSPSFFYSQVFFSHSLISGNTASSNNSQEASNYGRATVNDFNIFGNNGDSGVTGFSPGATDLIPSVALDAILNPLLADNGGPTQTHALVPGSPAIDAVTDNSCPPPATDQRGVERPQDGDDDNSADCDIGAYEFQMQAMLNVTIDFKPGNKRNPINPHKQGGVWVAVLSDTQAPFDPASQVDLTSILFGPDGAEVIRNKVKDINKDGVGDLLLHFKIPDSGIMCGDVEATLSGETFSGVSIQGSDFIQTRGCKRSKKNKR